MEHITRSEAIQRVVKEFNLSKVQKKDKSFYSTEGEDWAVFYFDKREYTRDEVLSRLMKMFGNVNIIEGQCRVDPLTLLWTTVHIETRTCER